MILTAGFGIILIGFVGAILLASHGELNFRILHVSAAFLYERRVVAKAPEDPRNRKITLRAAVVRYLLAAAVIAGAGS